MVDGSNSPSIIGSLHDAREQKAINKVGIIIVNFYTAAYLRKCLAALCLQTRAADVIVIVNNGDRPGALDFVASEFPSIQLLEQNNIGFAAANNIGIEILSGCEWVALLNPDAFPEPSWMENLMSAARENTESAIFSSLQLQAENPEVLDGDGDTYHISGLAWRHRHGRPIGEAGNVREVFSACAGAALYRRDALLAVDGFDPAYFCYFEDVDLGFRLRLKGHRCMQVPSARVHHVGGAATGGERSDFALYHGHRNLVWTFVKNVPGFWFWIFLTAHLLLNLITIIWFACQGRGKVILRAKMDALKRLPAVWRQRRQIQKARRVSAFSLIKKMNFWPFTYDR